MSNQERSRLPRVEGTYDATTGHHHQLVRPTENKVFLRLLDTSLKDFCQMWHERNTDLQEHLLRLSNPAYEAQELKFAISLSRDFFDVLWGAAEIFDRAAKLNEGSLTLVRNTCQHTLAILDLLRAVYRGQSVACPIPVFDDPLKEQETEILETKVRSFLSLPAKTESELTAMNLEHLTEKLHREVIGLKTRLGEVAPGLALRNRVYPATAKLAEEFEAPLAEMKTAVASAYEEGQVLRTNILADAPLLLDHVDQLLSRLYVTEALLDVDLDAITDWNHPVPGIDADPKLIWDTLTRVANMLERNLGHHQINVKESLDEKKRHFNYDYRRHKLSLMIVTLTIADFLPFLDLNTKFGKNLKAFKKYLRETPLKGLEEFKYDYDASQLYRDFLAAKEAILNS